MILSTVLCKGKWNVLIRCLLRAQTRCDCLATPSSETVTCRKQDLFQTAITVKPPSRLHIR